MKRSAYDKLIQTNQLLKRQCTEYLEKYKNTHYDWEFKDNAFIEENETVHAYLLDGILYDNRGKPVPLINLDIPYIPKDVWYVIMTHLDGKTIYDMEYLCVRMAKCAARIWKERGLKILDTYGPVFSSILKDYEWNFRDFFHACVDGVWWDGWLPFETLFSLPPGHAMKYIGNCGPQIAVPAHSVKMTYGVIETAAIGEYVGFLKKKNQHSVVFYWGVSSAKAGINIKSGNRVNQTMGDILKNGKIKSPIRHWSQYKELINL